MAVIRKASKTFQIKPGQQKKHATPRVMASALPRTIVFSSPRRRMVKPGATGSPHAIAQQEVTNSQTGKKAVGPWLGPFAAASAGASGSNPMDSLIPTTIYMDKFGGCHLDLDPSDDKRMAQQLYKAQSDSGLLSEAADEAAAKVASQQLVLRREQNEQARAAQAHRLFAHVTFDKTPAPKICVRRNHILNQPQRRGFN